MFTTKYIYPNGSELIETGFTSVSMSRQIFEPDENEGNLGGRWVVSNDGTGYPVVYAHRPDDTSIQIGPVVGPKTEVTEPRGVVEPVVYVMNERGATVATYRL